MFAILNALQTFWTALNWNFHRIWDLAKQYLVNKWAAFILLIGVVWEFLQNAVSLVSQCVNMLEDIATNNFQLAPPGVLSNALAIANTFFPLAEFFVLLIAYVGILAILFIYRFIKTMVPAWGDT